LHPPLESLNFIIRKNAHIFLYAVLTWKALSSWPRWRLPRLAALGFSGLYAASDAA